MRWCFLQSALAGIIIGWIFVGFFVLIVLGWLMFGMMAAFFTSIPWDQLPSPTDLPSPGDFPTPLPTA